ncbi:MAG: hypothetical protein ACOY90_10355 [Candidatus Zhuqueibacterota bacterium]
MCGNFIDRCIILFGALGVLSLCQAGDGYIRLNAAIHCDTQISGGKHSPETMAEFFSAQKLDAAFITDHDHVSAEYGIFPFRNALKYRHHRPSIHTLGAARYLDTIRAIDQQTPGVIIFPGIEAVPFYHWEGSFVSNNLRLKNWHRHVLVLGLNRAGDVDALPSPLNNRFGPYSGVKIIIGVAGLIGLIVALGCFVRMHRANKAKASAGTALRVVNHRAYPNFITPQGQVKSHFRDELPYSFRIVKRQQPGDGRRKWAGIVLKISMVGCVLAVLAGYPWKATKYSLYSGDYGAGPYQDLIDYVNEKQGLTFWAHPEAHYHSSEWSIDVETLPYPELLLQTFNYTGFAIFWEGMHHVGRPGGIWDMVLNQYCLGKRDRPVWAIGELDFEEQDDPRMLRETLTPVWAKERSAAAIMDALGAGRMYATRNFAADFIHLETFALSDANAGCVAISGQEYSGAFPPEIRISLTLTQPGTYHLELIRNGQAIRRFEPNGQGNWTIAFRDGDIPAGRKSYYRFLIYRNNWAVLASNPIFASDPSADH